VEFHNFHAEGVPSRLIPVGPADERLCAAITDILNNEKAAVFVGCLGGQVSGFVEVYLKETQPDPAVVQRRFAHVQSLMVAAAMRRHGIGARLMAATRDWATAQGATEVELEIWEFPAGPLPFYESLGFRTTRRTLVCDYSTPATRL
jgi:GNAT superfamily N-acetyltransferase